jgi:hypothetical protein
MPHPRFSNEEIARRGEQIYAESLREIVETEENIGKIIIIDIETGEYEVDASSLVANRRALARRPGAALYGIRIGYDVVEGFGGFAPQRVKR